MRLSARSCLVHAVMLLLEEKWEELLEHLICRASSISNLQEVSALLLKRFICRVLIWRLPKEQHSRIVRIAAKMGITGSLASSQHKDVDQTSMMSPKVLLQEYPSTKLHQSSQPNTSSLVMESKSSAIDYEMSKGTLRSPHVSFGSTETLDVANQESLMQSQQQEENHFGRTPTRSGGMDITNNEQSCGTISDAQALASLRYSESSIVIPRLANIRVVPPRSTLHSSYLPARGAQRMPMQDTPFQRRSHSSPGESPYKLK